MWFRNSYFGIQKLIAILQGVTEACHICILFYLYVIKFDYLGIFDYKLWHVVKSVRAKMLQTLMEGSVHLNDWETYMNIRLFHIDFYKNELQIPVSHPLSCSQKWRVSRERHILIATMRCCWRIHMLYVLEMHKHILRQTHGPVLLAVPVT